MDTVEDSEEGDRGLVLEEALLPGLMLAWEEEAYQDVVISSAELQTCLPRRVILLMAALGLRLILEKWLIREPCHMVMAEHL